MFKLKSLKIKNIISFKEQEFTFRNGKAVMIVGQNLSDFPNQQANGAGKSSLIESVALVFTGNSIRDVKTKELIHAGEESGEVTLTLLNAITGHEFKIWRKIYSNTKSAEYRAWIDNKEQLDRYADLNQFNTFVWDTIGISKEDFFNFFLITKDQFQPFLLVGDTQKKSIINRFSGADKVDTALPLIQEDSEKISREVCEIEKDLARNQAKQEVLAGQLLEEEDKVSNEKHLELINEKKDKLEKLEELGWDIRILLDASKDGVTITKKAVDEFSFTQDYETELQGVTGIKKKREVELRFKKEQLPLVKDQFKPELDAIDTEENDLKTEIKSCESELREHEAFESSVQKQLQDTIECPSCHHHFSLRNKSFNYDEAKKELPIVQETISEYKELIAEIKKQLNVDIHQKQQAIVHKVLNAGDSVRKEIEALNSQLVDLGNKELQLKRKQQEEANALQQLQNNLKRADLTLKQKENELEAHQQKITFLQSQIDNLLTQEIDRSKIIKLTNDIETLVKAEEKIKDLLEVKRKEKEEVDKWSLHFKLFKSHLANQSLKNIESYTNLFLQNMGSNLSIAIDGYKSLSNGKLKEQISTTVRRDGFESGSYGKHSGGERARVDICNVLSLQELILLNVPHGKGLDMLLCDEILESVDVSGMESIVTSLQSLEKTIMIVSQHTEISALAEHTITIQKKNKVSTILN